LPRTDGEAKIDFAFDFFYCLRILLLFISDQLVTYISVKLWLYADAEARTSPDPKNIDLR